MTDPHLVQALDYILNHSDESSIEALAEAVVRRRRDFAAFGAVTIDPQKMTKAITEQLSSGIGDGIENLKKTVRDMAVRIIREQAPELSDAQVEELCRTWIPEKKSGQAMPNGMSRDMLLSMIEQFVSFSRGTMKESVDKSLRDEMGAWPERYWKAFPPVIRGIITDFLKDRINETDFNTRIGIALEL